MEINSNHILGALIGFLTGYLVGVFTSKLLKLVLGLVLLLAAAGYVYFYLFHHPLPQFNW